MATMVDLTIAGRTYQVACREGEEDSLRAAARLVDGKSREALAGLGTLSEADSSCSLRCCSPTSWWTTSRRRQPRRLLLRRLRGPILH